MMETEINLPYITADATGPKHLQIRLTRATFEQITGDLVERCRVPFEQRARGRQNDQLLNWTKSSWSVARRVCR